MCIFCSEDMERTICVNCLRDEDKLNVFQLITCIDILAEKKVMNEEIKDIKDRYFELKKKKLNVGEIYHIIIKEFEKKV